MALLLGPIEEFGWRGIALPVLQQRFVPFWSGLILGVIWGVWHIPTFLLSGTPQSAWSVGPYLAGVVALCITLTPLFSAAKGSLLIAKVAGHGHAAQHTLRLPIEVARRADDRQH